MKPQFTVFFLSAIRRVNLASSFWCQKMINMEASGCTSGTAWPAETDVMFSRTFMFSAFDTGAEEGRLSKPLSPLYNT